MKQKHVHATIVLDLVDELEKLVEPEHRIEEEAEECTIILSIHSLIDTKVNIAIIMDGLANDHYILHREGLLGNLLLAELVLDLLIHLLPQILDDFRVKARCVQILQRVRVLL